MLVGCGVVGVDLNECLSLQVSLLIGVEVFLLVGIGAELVSSSSNALKKEVLFLGTV